MFSSTVRDLVAECENEGPPLGDRRTDAQLARRAEGFMFDVAVYDDHFAASQSIQVQVLYTIQMLKLV